MGKISGLIQILDDGEMELLHRSALRVLAEVGMRVRHTEALGALEARGCRVDFDLQEVKFPPEVVEQAVARLRRDFSPTAAPNGDGPSPRHAERVPMRYTAMYFTSMPRCIRPNFDVNCGGFSPFIYDLAGNRRPATLQDVRDGVRLAMP